MARTTLTAVVVATFANAADGSPIVVEELTGPNGAIWEHRVTFQRDGETRIREYGDDYSTGYSDAMFEAKIMAGLEKDPFDEPYQPMSPLEEAESGAGMEKIRDWQYEMRNSYE